MSPRAASAPLLPPALLAALLAALLLASAALSAAASAQEAPAREAPSQGVPTQGATAQGAASWSLQVTGPDHELRHHDLDASPFKPFLPTTSWRCFAGTPSERGGLVLRTLRCNYSVEPTGEFETTISCGEGKPRGEALIDLRDERKGLSFRIRMLCRHTGA